MVLPQGWIEIDRKGLQVRQHDDPAAVLEQATDAVKVLVVLEHQPLRGIPVQGVVRGTRLDELVELAKEVQFPVRSHEVESGLNSRVIELDVRPTSLKTYRDPLDQVSELGEDVLRKQCPLVGERVDVLADRLVSALDLVTNRSH